MRSRFFGGLSLPVVSWAFYTALGPQRCRKRRVGDVNRFFAFRNRWCALTRHRRRFLLVGLLVMLASVLPLAALEGATPPRCDGASGRLGRRGKKGETDYAHVASSRGTTVGYFRASAAAPFSARVRHAAAQERSDESRAQARTTPAKPPSDGRPSQAA